MLPILILAVGAFAADWKITAKPTGPLKPNVDVPFEVRVTDAKGAPVEGAAVELVLTMVDMDHGEFKSSAKQTKPGIYTATSKFMMGGAWNVEVRAKKGSDSASSKQKIQVKD